MRISRTAVLIGTFTISGAWALAGAHAETNAEVRKDRIDDRADKEKDQIDSRANIDKARVDDRAQTEKNEVDRTKTAKDTSVKGKKEGASEEVSDTWITAKVKADFVGDKALKGADIHVDTQHQGVLVLSGFVPNGDVRAHAVAVAKNTKGVRIVEDKLEIKTAK
jgi:osmotically-inducible protein OsmY